MENYKDNLIIRARELIEIIREGREIPKEDKNMLSITAFVQAKEIILPKDEDETGKKHIYFDYEKNKDYIPYIKNILTYVEKSNGFDSYNDGTIIHIENGPEKDYQINNAILLINRIRDCIRHGDYDIDDNNNTLVIDAKQNGYFLKCAIPIYLLDIFSTCGSSMIINANRIYASDGKNSNVISDQERTELANNQSWRLLLQISNNLYKENKSQSLEDSLLIAAIYNYAFVSLSSRDKNEKIENFEYYPFKNMIVDYYGNIKTRLYLGSIVGKALEKFKKIYDDIFALSMDSDNFEEKLISKFVYFFIGDPQKPIAEKGMPQYLQARNKMYLESLSNAVSHSQVTINDDGLIVFQDTKKHSDKSGDSSHFIMMTKPGALIDLLDVINTGKVDLENIKVGDILDELNNAFNSLIIDKQIQEIAKNSNLDKNDLSFLNSNLNYFNHLVGKFNLDILREQFQVLLNQLYKDKFELGFEYETLSIQDLVETYELINEYHNNSLKK